MSLDSTIWVDAIFAMANADAPVVSTSDPLIVEKELVHEGEFSKHTDDGEIKYKITKKFLDHWHKTFAEMSKDSVQVPMPLEHTRNPEARRATLVGMVRKPNSKGIESLFGQVKFKDAKAKADLIASNVSIYVPKKSGKYTMPIEHVAFTDYPVISTLESFAIVASLVGDEIEDDMTLRELATQAGIDPAIVDEQQLLMALSQKLAAIPKPPVPGAPVPGAPVAPPRPPMPGARFSKDKKENEPQYEPLTGSLLSMVKQNRSMALSILSKGDDARITPATRKELEDRFCSDEALSFSHVPGASDDFDAVISALQKNPPIRSDKKSGAQALALSKDELTTEKNPLVANAERRRKEASHN